MITKPCRAVRRLETNQLKAIYRVYTFTSLLQPSIKPFVHVAYAILHQHGPPIRSSTRPKISSTRPKGSSRRRPDPGRPDAFPNGIDCTLLPRQCQLGGHPAIGSLREHWGGLLNPSTMPVFPPAREFLYSHRPAVRLRVLGGIDQDGRLRSSDVRLRSPDALLFIDECDMTPLNPMFTVDIVSVVGGRRETTLVLSRARAVITITVQ